MSFLVRKYKRTGKTVQIATVIWKSNQYQYRDTSKYCSSEPVFTQPVACSFLSSSRLFKERQGEQSYYK